MSLLQKRNDHPECRALFWCEPTDGDANVSDHLSEAIVSHVFAQRDRSLQESFPHDLW